MFDFTSLDIGLLFLKDLEWPLQCQGMHVDNNVM